MPGATKRAGRPVRAPEGARLRHRRRDLEARRRLCRDQIDVQVRTEKNGTWSGWTTAAYHDEHGPDAGTAEEESARERPGTDALVVGDVDRVQMRAETTDGSTPPDLKLAVIDPGTER